MELATLDTSEAGADSLEEVTEASEDTELLAPQADKEHINAKTRSADKTFFIIHPPILNLHFRVLKHQQCFSTNSLPFR